MPIACVITRAFPADTATDALRNLDVFLTASVGCPAQYRCGPPLIRASENDGIDWMRAAIVADENAFRTYKSTDVRRRVFGESLASDQRARFGAQFAVHDRSP